MAVTSRTTTSPTDPQGRARTSKAVTTRLGAGRFLLTALWGQGSEVARLSLEQVRPHLRPGDREPDFHADMIGLARQLEGTRKRLEEADEKIYAENAELDALLQERRSRTRELRAQLVGLRRTIVGQYRAPDLIALGLERQTARGANDLLRQAARVSKTFMGDDTGDRLGESFFPRPTFDPRIHGEDLVAGVDAMRALLLSIDEKRRHTDEALLEKREAIKEFDRIYLRTARMFEELCRHAGKEGLAERVRPTVRSRRSAREEPTPDTEETGLFAPAPAPPQIPDPNSRFSISPRQGAEQAPAPRPPGHFVVEASRNPKPPGLAGHI